MNSKATITLHSFLFLVICPIILIGADALIKTFVGQASPALTGAVASCFTLLATFLFVRWDGITVQQIGVGFNAGSVPRYLTGFLIGTALVAFQNLVIFAGGHIHWVIDKSQQSFSGILLALTAYLLLALREELAFRGYSLRRMETAWGMWPALLLICAVFALEHVAGGWSWSRSLLGSLTGAILFGMAALVTRGLAVPFGIHSAFNFMQWVMGQKETPGPLKMVVDVGFAHQVEVFGYAAYLAGMIIAAWAFWFWGKRRISE